MLFSLLKNTWPLTLSSSLAGFLATIITVRYFGPEAFADYVIDLAKLSILTLVAEIVPSPFSIFKQQTSLRYKNALPYFYIISALIGLVVVFSLNSVGLFSVFSLWMYLYCICAVVQRYVDCRLQAEGRMKDFFFLPLITNICRLPILYFSANYLVSVTPVSVLWGSLSIGSSLSILVFFFIRRKEFNVLSIFCFCSSCIYLWRYRRKYLDYYPNILLKRIRDTAMPLVCDNFVSDRTESGIYFLAYRGVEVVCGQLRVIEALLSNFALRSKLSINRRQSMVVVAIAGQCAAALASLLLAGQVSLESSTFFLAFCASFFIYPYVSELTSRSDAYASFTPRLVTVSLASFVTGVAVTIVLTSLFTELTAYVLIFAPLCGQTLAALSYRIWPKRTP